MVKNKKKKFKTGIMTSFILLLIGLLSQHLITWIGFNASSTSLIRKITNSKRYPVERPPHEISSLETIDALQI